MPKSCSPTPPSSGPDATCPVSGAAPCAGASAPAPPKTPWVGDMLKIMCPKDRAFLDTLRARGVTITAYRRIYFEDPYYDGATWTTKHFEAGGTTAGTDINMILSSTPENNAATIYHEGIHTGQPARMKWRDKEYQAYVEEDRWRIGHGLPPHEPSFRGKDISGKPVTDEAAIRRFVDKKYPGVTATPSSGAAPEQVIGRTKSGKTIVQRSDGSTYTRRPKKGDSYAGPEITEPPGGMPVNMSELACP
jgi:hypothetical protein